VIALLGALVLVPLLALAGETSTASAARQQAIFTPLPGVTATGGSLEAAPSAAFRVDVRALRATLAGGGAHTVALPAPDGRPVTFEVAETPTLDAASQAAHPEIRTYSGHAADGTTVGISITTLGVSATVRRPDGVAWYLDPATVRTGEDRVVSHAGSARGDRATPIDQKLLRRRDSTARAGSTDFAAAPGGVVSSRTFRLALVSDPTYATFFGTSNVLSAKTALIARVNEVYNDDLAIHFILDGSPQLNLDTVAEFSQTNGPCGARACYPGAVGSYSCLNTLDHYKFVLGQLIGADTYDIGHAVLGIGSGGVAFPGVVGTADKAGGCSGIADPNGDGYAVNIVAHELGHQMGAYHSLNGLDGNCFQGRNQTPSSTQVEPGSGSTVMGYGGAGCQSDELQPSTDPYFSFVSADQINAVTSAAPGAENEVQTLALSGFDADGDSVQLTYPSMPSQTVVRGAATYTAAAVAAKVQALTGCLPVIHGYGTPNNLAVNDNGFELTFDGSCAGTDLSRIGVGTTTGGVAAALGVQVNGGPDTNGGTVAATTNHSPAVTAPAARTIPKQTPFTLTGSATDSDSSPADTRTFVWEQTDPGGSFGTPLVANNKVDGPLFRVFGTYADVSAASELLYHSPGANLAGTSPSRTFPDLAQVVAGNTNAAVGACPDPLAPGVVPVSDPALDCFSEFLPTADWVGTGDRVLHFRLTARDEFTPDAAADHVGGVSWATTTLTVDPTAGPFLVTSRASSGSGSGSENVTWDVAGTNTSALAQQVRISLSTDGGATFPTVLAASTPNDGSQTVVLPNVTTSTARIKIEAVGNYFFDVNDADFSITPAPVPPPAASTTAAKPLLKKVPFGKAFKVDVTVSSSNATSGTVQIYDGRRLLGAGTLANGRVTVKVSKKAAKKLGIGKHRLTATYLGAATVTASQTTFKVKIVKRS
jgi:hypothetical protein